MSQRDKPRLALNNNTAGVREREDANRTREAGHLDEIQGVVANAEVISPSRTDTQPRSLPHVAIRICVPRCASLCSSREPKQLLLHLTKRSHGCQRVHIVPPLHDLSALDGNDRDEPVVGGGAGCDNTSRRIVLYDDK